MTREEGNPIGDVIHTFKALFKHRESDSTRIILSKLHRVFSSKAVAGAFAYFCLHGAATSLILRNELDVSEDTSHRVIQRLSSLGFIVPVSKVSRFIHGKGGACSTIWALEDASPNEVAEALKKLTELKAELEAKG